MLIAPLRDRFGVVQRLDFYDVESVEKDKEFLGIARSFFSPPEYSYLCSLPEDKIPMEFYKIWVRKEAYLKAIGTGLSKPMNSVSLITDHGETIVNEDNNVWQIVDITPDEGYVGAVAVKPSCKKIKFFNWNGSPELLI
jgi:4'-phosphopantetheinyl transferase